jgi:LacI family transcriptional regulator
MVTIFDVARKAHVSVVTVSRLMNNPQIVSPRTADKIHKVMEQLNYQPSQLARSLVGKRTNTIGVILPDIKNTLFNTWFRNLEELAGARDINLLLCNTDDDPNKELKYVKLLQAQRVDGVIIAPFSRKSVEYLMRIDMRFVLFDRMIADIKTNFVTTDHYQGAYDALEYLVRLGHRRIAIMKGPGIILADTERYAAYKDVLRKHRLKLETELVRNCEFNEELACESARELLRKKKGRPSAIFTLSGLMTQGVIKAIQAERLSIPRDVSLLGFDDIPGQEIFLPRITHVQQPVEDLAREVMMTLLTMISREKPTQRVNIYLKPTLVLGDSCRYIY